MTRIGILKGMETRTSGYVHPHPHVHTQLKKLGTRFDFIYAKKGFPNISLNISPEKMVSFKSLGESIIMHISWTYLRITKYIPP